MPRCDVLVFDRAAELRASQSTHVALGAIYTGSTFEHAWFDESGARLFRIHGEYHAKKPVPEKELAWRFAEGAELAWSEWYYSRAAKALGQTGTILFRIDSRRSIRIGHGILEFDFGGPPARVTREEIGSVSLRDGQFTFKTSDANGYSRASTYSFPYRKVANAKVFLTAMERLMGYRWS